MMTQTVVEKTLHSINSTELYAFRACAFHISSCGTLQGRINAQK
jgi:hypothetical protein